MSKCVCVCLRVYIIIQKQRNIPAFSRNCHKQLLNKTIICECVCGVAKEYVWVRSGELDPHHHHYIVHGHFRV